MKAAAVLTVSDGVSAGMRDDASGDALAELLEEDGYAVSRRVVPDERETIAEAIVELCADAQVVLTTGGTGVAPRDVTPEATRAGARSLGSRDRGGDSCRRRCEDAARRCSRAGSPAFGERR